MRLRRRDASGTTSCRHGHTIGLDLGATAARVVVVSVEKRDARRLVVVEQAGGVPLAPGTVVNGVVADPAALTAALKDLWREQRIKCRHVVLGVANTQVQVRLLQMPDLAPAQRAQALPFQAREVVALPLDMVVLDYAPLGGPAGDSGLVDGLLVASPREPVETAVAAVEAAGLRVDRVDLASLAVLRSVAREGLTSEAVVDIGAHLTTVVVHRDGVPTMVRTLARGGDELTTVLAERLGIDPAEAEVAKREEGLTGARDVADALQDAVTPLLTDIRTSLNYFRSGNGGVRLEHVSLTGRGALLPGLADAVSAQVGTTASVETGDRLAGSTSRRAAADLTWSSALGVGLAIGMAA